MTREKLLRGMALAVLIGSPWLLGGRLPWLAMSLSIVAIGTFAIAFVPPLLRRQPPGWLACYGAAAAFLAWSAVPWLLGTSAFAQVSAYRWIILCSYAAFLALCVQLCATRKTVEKLVAAQVGVALAVATFSLLQYFSWNGLLYWIYEPPYGGVRFGPFNNNNYYAAFMVPALGLACGLAWSRARKDLDVWLGSAIGLGIVSILLAGSRSGAISLGAMLLTVLAVSTVRADASERDWRRPAVALAVLAVLVVAAVFGIGRGDEVFSELETIAQAGSEASFLSRLHLWRAAVAMALERPLTGFGLGTFGWVLMPYRTDVTTNFSMHAHNEFLEALMETGVVGLVLVVLFLVFLLDAGWRRIRAAEGLWEPGVRIGALAAWVGTLVFAMLDFPSEIPAVGYLLGFLGALMVADLAGPSGRAPAPSRRSRTGRGSSRGGRKGRHDRKTSPVVQKPAGATPEKPGLPSTPEQPPVRKPARSSEPDWHKDQPHPLDLPADDDGSDEDSSDDEESGRGPALG